MYKCGLAVVCLFLGACALPVDPDAVNPHPFAARPDLEATALAREASGHFDSGRYIDAELKLRQSLYLVPGAQNVRLNLASALMHGGQFEEAERIYTDFQKKNPDVKEYMMFLAQLYYAKGDFAKAEELYGQALQKAIDGNDIRNAIIIARSLSVLEFRTGKNSDALCYSDLARTLSSNSVDELVRHTRLQVALGYNGSARDLLAAYFATAAGARDPRVLHQLALAHIGLKNYQEALRLEGLAIDLSNVAPALLADINLVVYLIPKMDPTVTGVAAAAEETDRDEDKSFKITEYTTTAAQQLYWPPRLVEAYRAELLQAENEER